MATLRLKISRLTIRIGLLLLSFQLIISCSKKEVAPIVAEPPAILGTPITDTISPSQNDVIDVFGVITIKFHQALDKVVSDNYRPVLDSLSLNGAITSAGWNSDRTQVTFHHSDAFTPNSKLTVRVVAHWEQNNNTKGTWQVVSWNNTELRETKTFSFTVGDMKIIDPSNVQYAYPIPNQYHFLAKEYPKGFLKLVEGQSYLFMDPAYESWVEFQTPSALFVQSLIYDQTQNKVSYQIPNMLSNETIYNLSFKRKERSTGNVSMIYQYAFRTSKFNTFSEKVASFDLSASVKRGLFIPWSVDFLVQNFTSGEYFDDFEMESKMDTLKKLSSPPIPYATNLIQFSAIFSGNNWFDTRINPLLYAPWTNPFYKPTITARDTTRVGLKPKKAMSIQGTLGGRLTSDQISLNSAAAIPNQSPYLLYHVCAYLDSDFLEIQQQVAKDYLSQNNVQKREDDVIWGQFPIMTKGNYYYMIVYKLPDGTITTSIKQLMYNPIG